MAEHATKVCVARGGGMTRYYATCRSCRWSGDLHADRDVAQRDGDAHEAEEARR